MKNKNLGAILYLIAIFVTPIFNLIGFITILFKPKKIRNKVFKDLAISKDQHSGVYVQFWFNSWMLKNESKDLFGHPDETISSVLGKNKRSNKLTKFGLYWANWLNKREANHVELSIEDDEKQKNK